MGKLDRWRRALPQSVPDGAFSSVAAMTVGRHQLILYVIGGKEMLQSGQCLVVERLEFWFETLGSDFLMDMIIRLLCGFSSKACPLVTICK
jgi:hypothetical protein